MKKAGRPSAWNKHEEIRRAYLPKHVRMLFVGESPPASGRFFYSGDSGLYRVMRDVFQKADLTIEDDTFLARFRDLGCYLIDLCAHPVDQLERKDRRAACIEGEPELSTAIRELQPKTVVSLVRSIRRNVAQAAASADWHGPILYLPYPGRWTHHKEIFQAGLLPHVQAVVAGETIDIDPASKL